MNDTTRTIDRGKTHADVLRGPLRAMPVHPRDVLRDADSASGPMDTQLLNGCNRYSPFTLAASGE